MKRNKVLPITIGIVASGLLLAFSVCFNLNKGTEQYDVVAFGDSIIAGVHNDWTIPAYIEREGGYHTLNAGYGGMGMSNVATTWLISDSGRLYSMVSLSEGVRLHDFSKQIMGTSAESETTPRRWCETSESLQRVDWDNVKYIIVEHGANDYLTGIRIENPDDKYDANTFAGALRLVLKNISIGAPDAKIVILTPIYQKAFEDLPDCHSHSFGGGTLDEYVEKEIEIAEEFGAYIIDNFHEVDINISNYKEHLPGGLHPTWAANGMISANIIKHLEELDENS